jgi:pimeloyl-ACP methyl ester carboxylesterase
MHLPPTPTVPSFSQWQTAGRMIQVDGHSVFVREMGTGPACLVILHGYPTCSYDYHRVLPLLAAHFRVIVHDHPGFGLSGKPRDYSYSLIEQTDIALGVWRQLGVDRAQVVAHDYGTSIATELIARQNRGLLPLHLESLTLCNGSMHIELAHLRPIQRLLLHPTIGPWVARFSNYAIFERNMRKIWGDPTTLDREELAILWQMLLHNNGRAVLPALTQYIAERKRFWHRWIGGLQTTDCPIRIVWATEDPVAVVKMAHTLHAEIANSELRLLPGLGHYPMLEQPKAWTEALLSLHPSPNP